MSLCVGVCVSHNEHGTHTQTPISERCEQTLTSAIKPPSAFGSGELLDVQQQWHRKRATIRAWGWCDSNANIFIRTTSLSLAVRWHNGKQLNILYEKHSNTMRSSRRWTSLRNDDVISSRTLHSSVRSVLSQSRQASDNYYVRRTVSHTNTATSGRDFIRPAIHKSDLSNTKSTVVGRQVQVG